MNQSSAHEAVSGPATPWLALGFLLAGLGTALLGPILPYVASEWHLTDASSGSLFLAKFIGAFLGGISVSRRLRISIFLGALLCCMGFAAFAVAPGVIIGAMALLVSGFGLGQIIAATNILAGLRFRRHTGSALASLNFFWSLGAVATGVLAASFVPHFGLRGPLLSFAALLFLVGAGGWITSRGGNDEAPEFDASGASLVIGRISIFALLLFLYGGLETCLTSWLTTFALRFSDTHLLRNQSAVVLFWGALTAGRLLASFLLRIFPERTVQAVGLALSAVFIGVLAFSHYSVAISLECVLLGFALAPFFPAIWALLMHHHPPARLAGFILAVSGLGAAFFPWLMGLVSTSTGSLRLAMFVPVVIAVVMLSLTAALKPTGEAMANVVSS